MTASPADAGTVLANMSAPPRSTLVLKPFRVPGPPSAAPGAPSNWGLAWYGRVDFDQNLRDRWPEWARQLEDRAPGRVRLCGALALVRGQDPGEVAADLVEAMADELLRLAPALSGQLPPLLVATRASAAPRPVEPDPLRALAVLTHLSGRTCAPAGSALLSEALTAGHAIDLWTPEASHA